MAQFIPQESLYSAVDEIVRRCKRSTVVIFSTAHDAILAQSRHPECGLVTTLLKDPGCCDIVFSCPFFTKRIPTTSAVVFVNVDSFFCPERGPRLIALARKYMKQITYFTGETPLGVTIHTSLRVKSRPVKSNYVIGEAYDGIYFDNRAAALEKAESIGAAYVDICMPPNMIAHIIEGRGDGPLVSYRVGLPFSSVYFDVGFVDPTTFADMQVACKVVLSDDTLFDDLEPLVGISRIRTGSNAPDQALEAMPYNSCPDGTLAGDMSYETYLTHKLAFQGIEISRDFSGTDRFLDTINCWI